MKDESRNVTARDLLTAIFVVVFLFGGLFIVKVYSNAIGFIMIGAVLALGVLEFLTMSKEQKKAIGEAMEKHEKTKLGKLSKIHDYIMWVIFIIIIYSIINEYFLGKSS